MRSPEEIAEAIEIISKVHALSCHEPEATDVTHSTSACLGALRWATGEDSEFTERFAQILDSSKKALEKLEKLMGRTVVN